MQKSGADAAISFRNSTREDSIGSIRFHQEEKKVRSVKCSEGRNSLLSTVRMMKKSIWSRHIWKSGGSAARMASEEKIISSSNAVSETIMRRWVFPRLFLNEPHLFFYMRTIYTFHHVPEITQRDRYIPL